ncbi:MAG: Imm32 family immunity protein [Thermoleophilia bacterium]
MNEGQITFEISSDCDQLHVHGDPEGLRRLAAILERLAAGSESEHEHLMTEDWGRGELSSELQGGQQGDRLVKEVTIHCWIDNY